MRRPAKLLIVCAAILLVIELVVGVLYFQNRTVKAAASIGDVPFDFQTIDMKYLTKELNMVVYLSATCQSCVEAERNVKRLSSIMGDSLDILFIWDDEQPNESEFPSISLKKNQVLADMKPYYFLLDSNRQVILSTRDAQLAVDQVFERSAMQSSMLEASTINYLKTTYGNDQDTMYYFAMTGCSDCAVADDIISQSGDIQTNYSVVRIYKYNETDPEKDKDALMILKKALSIDWYPTFVIINKDGYYNIIRKTDPQNLAEAILSSGSIYGD